MGHIRGAPWYGSRLTIGQAVALAPHNNATSLQTAAGVLGGAVWAINHADAGTFDPDEMDFAKVMEVAVPYLGDRVGVYSDWTPLPHRGTLCSEAVDAEDPWPFRNILVT